MRILFPLLMILFIIPYSCNHRDAGKSANGMNKALVIPVKKPTSLDTLLTDLEILKKDTSLVNASLAYVINDYSSGKPFPVTAYNAGMTLVPASVFKILTTAAALEILGEGKTFHTVLQYDGKISNHVLFGNLYIKGGGDPTFGAPATFDRWMQEIRKLDIDSITGSVIGDATIFNRFTIPMTWTWGELLLPYCAPANGLTYSGNVFQAKGDKTKKGKYRPAKTEITPDIPGLIVENDISDTLDEHAETYLQGIPNDLAFSVQGTVMSGNNLFPYCGVIPDPALAVANELKQKLTDHGIRVGGVAVDIETADSAVLKTILANRNAISYVISPSVAILVTLTNLHSNNLFAEHLNKQIGLSRYHSGNSETGCKAVQEFWKSKQIDTKGMFLYDGCGVSRYDGITAQQLADILYYMTTSSTFATFYNSLPLAGVSGTLAKYMKGTKAEGNLRAKTGSISRVKSYAGYVRSASGKRLIFSILINNFTCSGPEMVTKLEKIMVDLASLR